MFLLSNLLLENEIPGLILAVVIKVDRNELQISILGITHVDTVLGNLQISDEDVIRNCC